MEVKEGQLQRLGKEWGDTGSEKVMREGGMRGSTAGERRSHW